jgi:hypothetical protein
MLRNGRAVDEAFKGRHHLYMRCTKEDVAHDRVIAARIKYDNPSVNWSKYSRPWDVIFDFPGYGIARFVVRYLPRELPKNPPGMPSKKQSQLKIQTFYPRHEPEQQNYSHCEIRTFQNGVVQSKPRISETVKKEFRQIMSDRSLVIQNPGK